MPRVLCDGAAVPVRDGQRLLDALIEAGIDVASSCRAGACQSCLVQVTRGVPPRKAQAGLRETLKAQGYILACLADVEGDLEVSSRAARELAVPGRVRRVSAIGRDILQVIVKPATPFPHRAGQFVTLVRPDGLSRAYSIASLPNEGSDRPTDLELHVRVLPEGRMSSWLAGFVGTDGCSAEVALRGPAGECFYVPGAPEQRLVLAGTGTGLAPLWGVARDALRAGHAGPIDLWHGVRDPSAFYLADDLYALERRYPQFRYRRCALEGAGDVSASVGRLDEAVLSQGGFAGSRVFLCGDPALVTNLKKRIFLAGAALKDIHADPFVTASVGSAPRAA